MPSLQDCKLCFIGGGNMAAAIIGGLASVVPKSQITVSEPWDVNRDKMAALGVRTTADNVEATKDSDLLVLAVKPQVAKGVCQELATAWNSTSGNGAENKTPVIISIAAGITLDSLREWCTSKDARVTPHVIRVMPNTPALVGEGASGLFAAGDVTAAEKELATALMGSVSKTAEWVDKEELIDVVTGLSGSGPAYFFAMVEHLITSATRLGMPEEQATRLAKQTCLGAGKMLASSSETPGQLRKNVTSPNGTTYAALQSFEADGFAAVVDRAVEAATKRGEELGKTLGSQ